MHEKHQVEHIVNEAIKIAGQQNLSKPTKVVLVIGDGLGFDNTSVNMYFEAMTEGTIFEGAKLEIKNKPAFLKCTKCGKDFIKVRSQLDCPVCKVQGLPSDKGKEFFIESVN
jgi:hydrogenase nickel incorporation protein HypA/HybF